MRTLGLDDSGQDLADLSPEVLLDLAERSVVARRAVEVEDLLVVGAWARVHSSDPRRDPRTGQRAWSEDRLVHPGGDGTPGCAGVLHPRARDRPGGECGGV